MREDRSVEIHLGSDKTTERGEAHCQGSFLHPITYEIAKHSLKKPQFIAYWVDNISNIMYRLELICHHAPHQCRCRHNTATEVNADDLTANLISNCLLMESITQRYSSTSGREPSIRLFLRRIKIKLCTCQMGIKAGSQISHTEALLRRKG